MVQSVFDQDSYSVIKEVNRIGCLLSVVAQTISIINKSDYLKDSPFKANLVCFGIIRSGTSVSVYLKLN